MSHFTLSIDYDKGQPDSYRGLVIHELPDIEDVLPALIISTDPISDEDLSTFKNAGNWQASPREITVAPAEETTIEILPLKEYSRVFTAISETIDTAQLQLETDLEVIHIILAERGITTELTDSITEYLTECGIDKDAIQGLYHA